VTVKQSIESAAFSLPDGQEAGYGARKWYLLGVLIMISVMGVIDRSVISVIAEPLKADFQLSDKQIGLLSGMAYSGTYALAILPMGWLVDRVNRRILLGVTVMVWSALTAICAVSTNFTALFLARMGVGAAEAPVNPASLSLVADAFPARQRNTAVSLLWAGAGFGVLLQFVIGGWVLAHFSWRAVFLVAGGPGLVLAALLYFTTREPIRGAFDTGRGVGCATTPKAPRAIDALRNILGNSALCVAIPAITITTGVFFSVVTWTTSFLVRMHGMNVSHAGILTGMGFGLCMTIGSGLAGPVADRVSKANPRRLALVPAAATFVAAIAGIVLTMSDSLPVALAGLGVLGLMAGFSLGPGYALILSLAAPNERGTTMAATKLITELVGGSVISFMTGAISDAIGGVQSIRPALFSNAAILLIATSGFATVHRILDRRSRTSGTVAAA
jgi:MFS family permease